MNKKRPITIEKLQELSTGSKIGVEIILMILLVILPRIFPGIIQIAHPNSLAINFILGVSTSIFYELLQKKYQKDGKDFTWIINAQIITSTVLLTWMLHLVGRINGPLFVIYLLMIMESALNLTTNLPNIVITIATTATIIEFIFLVFIGEIPLNLYHLLQLAIKIAAIMLMRSYGVALAQTIISEKKANEEIQKSTRKLRYATRKLQKANIRLRELSTLKDEFVSIASHQLRTPMTAIKSYLWLVMQKKDEALNSKDRKNLDRAYESTERTIALVKDMLTVSRIEGKRLDLDMVEIDLYELAKKVCEELKIKADEKGIHFVLGSPKTKTIVKADQERIREVLQNLTDNAIKFTPKGGRVRIFFKKAGRRIETSVSDTGAGISKQDMPKLFQKFSRLEHSFSKIAETPGTGLGLYIAKQVVGLHKGSIRVKSKVGKGSVFTFSLTEG